MPQLSPNNWKLLMMFSIFLVFQSTVLLWWMKSPSLSLSYPSSMTKVTRWLWK